MPKLKSFLLCFALAGAFVGGAAQADPITVILPTDPNTAVIANNTGQIAQTSAQMLQQQLVDANTRALQLQEAIKQTTHQQALLEQQTKANTGYWPAPADYVYTRAGAEIVKVNGQMAQMQALSHVYENLADAIDTRYPGAKDELPKDYDSTKFRQDMVNWAWTVQANAKGVLLSNKEVASHWLDQDAISRVVESNWKADMTPAQVLQMMMMLSTENLRQMVRLRQETANFTSLISSWLAGQAQKEINALRMEQNIQPNGDQNFPGFKTDPAKGFYAPHQLGWEFKSPLGGR